MEWQASLRCAGVGGSLAPQSREGPRSGPRPGAVADLQGRFVTALFPALVKLDEFASNAAPIERRRMFEPAA